MSALVRSAASTPSRSRSRRRSRSSALTRLLGPLPQLLILLGNAVTPGKGFSEGPFASEVEVRELVDLAAASSVIESDEGKMLQSVFELGDTIAREVMVPRTDLVFVERHKTLRQAMSLALRSGFSRMPVIDENLDDIIGMAYLKDVTKRVFDNHEAETTERIESIARPSCSCPTPSTPTTSSRRCRRSAPTWRSSSTSSAARPAWSRSRTSSRRSSARSPMSTTPSPRRTKSSPDGSWRLSSRFEVDDLEDLFDIPIEDEDVDSVGGLMAKHLGKVPIRGSVVEVEGLRFEAEGPAGRRNRIGRVLVSRIDQPPDTTASIGSDHGTQS